MKRSWLPVCLSVVLGASSLSLLAQPEPSEPPGPEDRAAVLKLNEGMLYTLAEEQEGVLQALGARPSEDGLWTASFRDASGKRFNARFGVIRIFDLEPVWPWRDPGPGDVVPCPNPDIQVYRNSVCGWPWLLTANFGCQNTTTGGSTVTNHFGHKVCTKKAGGGYCVNERAAISQTNHYNQSNCAGPIANITLGYGMICGY